MRCYFEPSEGGVILALGHLRHQGSLGKLGHNTPNQRHKCTTNNAKSSTLNYTTKEVSLKHKDHLRVEFGSFRKTA